ncbi:hypothetical protein D9V86_12640 [Bacteroidetes/Chlorobi group bacterium ChocPot_Mid]|jgi:hypothetical protein|nr:MAG: hypothetical protein D9V86_12640 [Bacteroidetes/Chlorobi group bacterium ChocPot_Mid]
MKFNNLKIGIKVISVIILSIILYNCNEENINKPNKKDDYKKIRWSLQNPPTISDSYDGEFYCLKSSGKMSLANYEDTTINYKVIDIPLTTSSQSIFGDWEKISYAEINGAAYTEYTNNNQTYYAHDSPTINVDGSNNIFTYQLVAGSTVYRDTVAVETPVINFTTPTFMQSISRNNDLTITWSASNYQDDYVEISLQGKPIIPINGVDTTYNISYFSDYSDDTGTFVIPSNILASFVQSYATLTINRGYYKEFTHDGKTFLLIISTARAIDIKLE